MPAKGSHNFGNRTAMKAFVLSAKKKPCADCGGKFPPCVMDFDHVRGKKEFNLGGNILLGLARVVAEIQKCDVVCANCHRLRTQRRLDAKKAETRKMRPGLTRAAAFGTKYGVNYEDWKELPERIN